MEKVLLDFMDSRRDLIVTTTDYEKALTEHMRKIGLPKINSTSLFIGMISRLPQHFNLRAKYKLLKYIIDEHCDVLYNISNGTDSLKEISVPLKWDRSFIDLYKFKLPNVRTMCYNDKIRMIDDVSLCQLIYSHVHALPKYLYTPVKKFVYANLPLVYNELFKSEDELRNPQTARSNDEIEEDKGWVDCIEMIKTERKDNKKMEAFSKEPSIL